MRKDPLVFVRHMLESIELIQKYLDNKKEDDFLDSGFLQDAVIRRLEIIGEAAKNLPLDLMQSYPKVPWSEIIRMRDKLAHRYFGVNLELAWQVVSDDLPELKRQLIKIKSDLEKIDVS